MDCPGERVYDLSTMRRPEIQGEISPRIRCSSLRSKCNSLLHLNRGLPGSAVDLSTVRQQNSERQTPNGEGDSLQRHGEHKGRNGFEYLSWRQGDGEGPSKVTRSAQRTPNSAPANGER